MSDFTQGGWKPYCLGSEGYQVRPDNRDTPITEVRKNLKERTTPIVYSMGGSFETQKANAHLIAAAPIGHELAEAVLDNKPRAELERIAMHFMDKAEGKLD